jgi:hypothetical protein
VTPEGFAKIGDHVIWSYFQHPSCWRIDGRPYFSFCDRTKLLDSFGSVKATSRGARRGRTADSAALRKR